MLSSGRRRGAVEWRIYHGLKWCLRLTKVLIIQSEEELPGHYLPENNNVNTRLLGLSRCILSELVSCSTIHSISNRPACPRIHSPGRRRRHRRRRRRPLPPTSTSPCVTSPCRAGCTPPRHPSPDLQTPFFSPLTSSCSCEEAAGAAPPLHPYLVLMSHCEIQADGWGTKG